MALETNSGIDFMPILQVIQRRVWYLVGFAMLGLIGALVFSKVVTPLFESSVVMYPGNSNSREKQLEDFSFGHEVHAERLLQLLQCKPMLDSLENQFNLTDHYEIDKTAEDWYDKLLDITRDRITFHKNKYVAVSISVVDADPQFCADVANETARLVNVINANIVKSSAFASLEVLEKEYFRRQGRVLTLNDSIVGIENVALSQTKSNLRDQVSLHQRRIQVVSDSLDRLRKQFNIYDFGYQINVLNEYLAEARDNYLQESGILEVLEKTEGVSDSTMQVHRGSRNGAKMRMDNFSKELNMLGGINMRYIRLENELKMENQLFDNANQEIQEFQSKVDPNFDSRRINRLEEDYRWDQLQTQELNAKYQNALSNYLDPVPAAIVISSGWASHQKVYPHTLLNLVLGCIGGFFFGLLLFTILDRKKGAVA